MAAKEFEEKVFIITGASSGIGEATALLAVEQGANVAFVARQEKKLSALCSSLPADHVEVIPADITKEDDRKRVVDRTLSRFGGIDVLVNAAGIIANGTIENTTLEQWDTMFDINLRSLFRLTQLALPSMIERKGNIVNVSSVTGIRAFPNVLAYCVSKAGVDQLTRCTSLELGPKGVRVNAVNPGVVVTNLHRSSGMPEETYQKFLEHSKTTHPIGRAGKPEEVAELILFLASDRAGWITGASFSIDGGRAQTCAR
ncbi:MAG: SDR family oxidoreductase [Ignavibacteriae bacterium]|nr:SDR family oxidoreductase [Ignavibacteria bacterium]MBI3364237.1 SDR family oxidoreductase [Ignavibacteriota bacterium]